MITEECSVSGDVIVNRIVELSKKAGRHERDLVEFLGLKRGTFSNWKRGQSDSYLHYLKEISEYFGVTPNYLILGDNGFEIREGEDIFTVEEIGIINEYRKIEKPE